jgi:hypothetical protein
MANDEFNSSRQHTFVGANGGVMVQWATANQCAGRIASSTSITWCCQAPAKLYSGWFSVAPWAGGGSGGSQPALLDTSYSCTASLSWSGGGHLRPAHRRIGRQVHHDGPDGRGVGASASSTISTTLAVPRTPRSAGRNARPVGGVSAHGWYVVPAGVMRRGRTG